MTIHASGTFHNSGWQEDAIEEFGDGAKLTRAHIVQDFAGDVTGTGTSDLLMCYRTDGTADYAGYLRLVGSIAGRAGSVVFAANGSYDGAEARTAWSAVTGTGRDGLASLRGQGSARAPHGPDGTFELDLDLE